MVVDNSLKRKNKQKAYIIKQALIEPYISKYLRRSRYVSRLSDDKLDKIRKAEEAYANKNRFNYL